MTTRDDQPTVDGASQARDPAPTPLLPATGAGHAFPATASGVPLSVFAFGFCVGILGLIDTGILSGAAIGMFIAVALGTGTVGLLVAGLWEFRGGNLFGATFAIAYALFLLSTAMILKFFAPSITAAGGAGAFGSAFGAWLLMWAVFTALLAVGARTVNLPAFLAFVLLVVVYVVLGIASIGGSAAWTDSLTRIGGWFALADGITAWYLGAGILLNVTVGRDLLPLWPYTPPATSG